MAKKRAKKKSPAGATKKARKAPPAKARKAGAVRRSAPKAASKAAPKTGVHPVSTGSGPGPMEIGSALVEAFNAGRPDKEIWDRWFSPAVASIEGLGVGMGWYGREAVEAKSAEWTAKNKVISAAAVGPFVGSTGFAVKFSVEVEDRASGQRQRMDEVGVYTVENGRVVREEFMYNVGGGDAACADAPPAGT